MIQWREGRVTAVRREWAGALELEVDVFRAGEGWVGIRALAYPALVGRPKPEQRVLLNTTALERGLGTGGYAMVVAMPDDFPVQAAEGAGLGPGHLVKARYTPLQAMVLGVDEQESEFHETLRDADELFGLPVVVADLHSSLPAVIAGIRAQRPTARVVHVLSDGGALPAWFSRAVAGLRDTGWLTACISAGQAFGGDLEAVSVHSALLAAHHVVHADVAVVVQGPGNLGTGTRWGFSGIAAGEAVNAAAVLGGRPVACLRISGADTRERHRGVSHHSLTAYGRVALAAADVVVPELAARPDLAELGALVDGQIAELVEPPSPHREVRVPLDGLDAALASSPVALSTMGRGTDEDPAAFLAAAAAGAHAAALLR